MVEIKIGGLYQHYKGKNYIVKSIAKNSESLEWMVVYECVYDHPESQIWVRPLKMFLEEVDDQGRRVPRFRYIGDQKGKERL
ncbi:MAG: DUF1653 domain-containing protein [Bacteriovoracaceae bacterium]